MVDELLGLSKDFVLSNGYSARVFLVNTPCDMPATRKIIDVVSHNASLACFFCRVRFPRALKDDGSKASNPDMSNMKLSKCKSFEKLNKKIYIKHSFVYDSIEDEKAK